MKPILNDQTTSTIVLANAAGEVVGESTLPTTLLAESEASTLRAYRDWLSARRIGRTFYCPICVTPDPFLEDRSRPMEMEAFITDVEILFSCAHRRLFFKGLTHEPTFRMERDEPLPDGFPVVTPLRIALVEKERQLLRAMKEFRRRYEIKESNQCQDCFRHGAYNPRMQGGVDDWTGKIALYCTHRRLLAPPSL